MELTITKEMAIGQVLNIHRGTARILMESGMHCIGCPSAANEPLEMACAVHGLDADEVLRNIHEWLEQNA